ncbi:MAG TPA: caspase family protein [Thermoanaerobaculia bacterium]|nr:caspase family protein [Thermoanaerobaculia bacterium]
MRNIIVLIACLLATDALGARRALLIGINDYSATATVTRARHAAPPPGRDWPNLFGAVNDVNILKEMLVESYGFAPGDVVTLTDHQATHDAILAKIEEHLIAPAAKGDVLFFYYAGHGSQLRNSLSDEHDQLDESIVPADSRLGAPDILDKELRRLFNRMLDRGARLTVMMDSCYSGSGARGLPTEAIARGVKPDRRDRRDAGKYGPLPASRGALVLAATQDFDRAWEIRDVDGKMHGIFSWAWIRALRDAADGEAASETFLRADARMRHETPFQEPVLAGTDAARFAPFLGTRTDRRGDRPVVAVEKVQQDGTVLLQGGWANGLSAGTELRVTDDPKARVTVTVLRGIARSEGRVVAGSIHSGSLLEVVSWTPPPTRPLRVWMPRMAGDLPSLARRLAAAASKRGVRWIDDPTEAAAIHLLRPGNGAWELLEPSGVKRVEPDPVAAVSRLGKGASLFVQFPRADALSIDGVVAVPRAEDADYLLAGRYAAGKLSYAWVRPMVRGSDRRRSALPARTAWETSPAALREHAQRLRRIQMWQLLESPPGARAPYRLALRRVKDRAFVGDGRLAGGEHYELVLRAAAQRPQPRYFYAFVIDSHGTSTLLYPQYGSGENRLADTRPQLSLGQFQVGPPYGLDTFILLATEEPLPSPWVLAWDGVRAGPLELSQWSLERIVFESVAPRRH